MARLKVEIRYALFIEGGNIAGERLERGVALPIKQFHFPLNEQKQAEESCVKLQEYLDKHGHKKGGNG